MYPLNLRQYAAGSEKKHRKIMDVFIDKSVETLLHKCFEIVAINTL